MRKHKRIGALLCIVACVAVVGLIAWRGGGPPEPVFNGRGLTSWLDHHVPSSSARPPYGSPGWNEAHEAIKSIGSNAVPTLLKMLRTKEKPEVVIGAIKKGRDWGLPFKRYRHVNALHQEAEYAFEILGTNAAIAIPGLIRIYDENISFSSQSSAANALGHVARNLKSGAESALPVLIERFDHTNQHVRFYAVSAATSIRGDSQLIMPALATALNDSYRPTRWNAAVGLGNHGNAARSIAPVLTAMLNDPQTLNDVDFKKQVEKALWRIAPETVGYPLVVENDTPVVRDGVTTLSLKMTFNGTVKTLIEPGWRLPVVAQYWSKNPRPMLTLYRSSVDSSLPDHFLGNFRVLDLPEEGRLNVSSLVVIADGQIVLCARNNTEDTFLPIERIPNNE